MRCSIVAALLALAPLLSIASAQLSGRVGPLTSICKKTTICNVLDYGAKADGVTDIGPAILSAFTNCVLKNNASTLYVPPGNYAMATWVTLRNGNTWAFQMDGIITRTGTAGGHMIIVQGGSDFEMFSKTRAGAFQGAGVDFHKQGLHIYGPRILRIVKVANFCLHDLGFFDSPAFHVILDNVSNGQVYNVLIRGHDEGGLDGLDVTCNNCHIQNIQVTNRDECVCVKSPSSNLLIEDVFCNQSGGMSMGSFNGSTAVENVYMRNIVSYYSTQFLMIKTYPNGNGYVRNCRFENFRGFTNAYALQITQYWQNSGANLAQDLSGVQLSNLTFTNWVGVSTDANSRAPVFLSCSTPNPCVQINVGADVLFWDPSHAMTAYKCVSAYGTGVPCFPALAAGKTPASYVAQTTTVKTVPAGWAQSTVPTGALASGFPLTSPIPVEPLPWPQLHFPAC
ncbi:glycoside hydrolase family 28 protein [Gonapodya prolifera JEL478]|uniref:Glycoside hydrolase family 28 protein n=1 Tax=Gonapodya prolifera (strain JEL478) TaxID=1344416 RepID=A0A139A7H4_GONPJ|nr:glycoside hydrolase family 28 protein [Gonapodya prolifera JEL478]|eukprot:KXS12639.1 glycoside hydrolase family 28 protein [Gonapodya prolifera JEL478]